MKRILKRISNEFRTDLLKIWMEVSGAKRFGKCRVAHKRERRYRRIRNFRPHNIRYAGKMRVINFYN